LKSLLQFYALANLAGEEDLWPDPILSWGLDSGLNVDHRIALLLLIWIYIVPRRLEDLEGMLLEVNRVGRTIGSRQTRSLG
jgi:hypothetical protein